MALAEVNQDRADELLLKRVAYYGIAISAPFILMRHWQQWQDEQTFAIDEQDIALCRLALDIQYHTQHHYFGEYAVSYFADMERDPSIERKRNKKTIVAYNALPDEFELKDVVKSYGTSNESSAKSIMSRLAKDGLTERVARGKYRKLKKAM